MPTTIKQRAAAHRRYAQRFKPGQPARKRPDMRIIRERLVVTSIYPPKYSTVRFTLSEDLVDRMVALHDRKWRAFIYDFDIARRYRNLRVQFIRMTDIPMAAVMLRILPPAQKGGRKLCRPLNARQFHVDIPARKIGIADAIVTRELETMWMDSAEALIALFPEGDCIFPSARAVAWHDAHHPGAELVVR
jgi:hypothetical protein